MIRFANIISESLVDGRGIRVVAFLQGCPRSCQSCHNEALIPLEGGKNISKTELAELILGKVTGLHHGVTFSGGDPLLQADNLLPVISHIREKAPKLDIWVYTGYMYEEIKDLPIMSLIDVLVDGPFILAQRDLSLAFRGSSNQRIIDVKQTRQTGKVVELYLDQDQAV